jgi:Skp family chaperone for outer membrane proteins
MKWLVLLVVLLLPSGAFSVPLPNFKVTNGMIYQKLTEIEKRQAVFEERFKQIDKRFEQIDKRFEQIDKRFEQVDRRFEQIDRRFEQIDRRFQELREDMNKRLEELREDMNMRFEQHLRYLGWLIAGMFGMMATFAGLLIWDRRTIIAEAKRQTLEELEREVKPEKLRKLLNVTREFAKENEKFREILKKEGLL